MAHFYDNKAGRDSRWEDAGGFNMQLLMEIRNAMLDVESGTGTPTAVQGAASEWIKRLPMFDFPDDEIG